MSRFLIAAVFGVFVSAASAVAEPVPCDKLVRQVDDAMKTAIVSDADKKRITDLRKRGLGECKGEKDDDADRDLQAALKLMGR